MTEKEYRAVERDSYSSFKVFVESRRKYFRKFINKEIIEEDEEETVAIGIGSLVDCLYFSPDDFDTRYVLVSFTKPTGQMLDFCHNLWKITKETTDPTGRVTRSFASLAEEAYNITAFNDQGEKVAFKQKGMDLQKVMGRFQEEGASYYNHLRTSNGRKVISAQELANAERVLRELKTSFTTRELINTVTGADKEVLNQLIIFYEYRGLKMKSMLDKVIIDHKAQTIQIIDLKTGWNVDGFGYNYLKYKLYIQAALYHTAIQNYVLQERPELSGYTFELMKFIVADSMGNNAPLIYTINEQQYQDALNGFSVNNYPYPGIISIAEDIKWHLSKGIWNISRTNYQGKGIVPLNY